jgi:NAD(P)H dehydrogenase (quinone)
MKILVIYYSMFGHIRHMAEAEAEGAASIKGARVELRRVPETLPDDVLDKMGALESQLAQDDVPLASLDELAGADALLFGTPTRFGNMCGQMRQFLDAAGQIWVSGDLIGKVAGVFTSSNTQHGGQESTILSMHVTLLHLGMVIAGLPYGFKGQMGMDEISGCSPYGASTIAGASGERQPSANELDGARYQGRYVTDLAARLTG